MQEQLPRDSPSNPSPPAFIYPAGSRDASQLRREAVKTKTKGPINFIPDVLIDSERFDTLKNGIGGFLSVQNGCPS